VTCLWFGHRAHIHKHPLWSPKFPHVRWSHSVLYGVGSRTPPSKDKGANGCSQIFKEPPISGTSYFFLPITGFYPHPLSRWLWLWDIDPFLGLANATTSKSTYRLEKCSRKIGNSSRTAKQLTKLEKFSPKDFAVLDYTFFSWSRVEDIKWTTWLFTFY
jgi:hypothetical protein